MTETASEPAGPEEPWDDRFVTDHEERSAVVEYLRDSQPARPSTMAAATDLSQQGVSDALRDLRERGLVTLLVDDDVIKGRLYALSGSEPTTRGFDWTALGYVLSSQYRTDCVLLLETTPRTSKELATDAGYLHSHMSRAVRELRESDIVQRRDAGIDGRKPHYGLTGLGDELAAELQDGDY